MSVLSSIIIIVVDNHDLLYFVDIFSYLSSFLSEIHFGYLIGSANVYLQKCNRMRVKNFAIDIYIYLYIYIYQ